MSMITFNETQGQVMSEICKAVEKLGGNFELLAIIGSFGDTIDDDVTLEMIRDYNKNGTAIAEIICASPDWLEGVEVHDALSFSK